MKSIVAWCVFGLVLSALLAKAQPKAEREAQKHPTLQWAIPLEDGWGLHTLRVIDTTGVCIYVFNGDSKGGIAVVPKTQLPSGAGCQ